VPHIRLRRFRQWLLAVAAEIRWSWGAQSKLGFLLDHYDIARLLLAFAIQRVRGAKPYAGWRKRLRACGRCPVFHKRLMTCGKPGDLYWDANTGQMQQRGCLCPLRVKAQVPEATCWSEDDHWQGL
jgi:hypothetical protein